MFLATNGIRSVEGSGGFGDVYKRQAGHPPHPKATLELLRGIESLFSLAIPLRTIEEETHAWERGAAELMEEEPELAAYVKQLESDQENSSLENMSGEDIAAEFERFLKRRDG